MNDQSKLDKDDPNKKSLNNIRDYYDEFLEYLKKDREKQNPRHLKIKQLLNQIIAPGDDVLDLGCGIGITTEFISNLGANVIGVDLSPKLIDYARQTVPQVDFYVSDICKFKIDKKFDVICMIDVLEHVPKARNKELFKNIKNLLKDGGKLFISIPNPKYHTHAIEQNIGAIQIVEEVIDLAKLNGIAQKNGLSLINKISYSVWNPDEYIALTFIKALNNIKKEARHKIIYTLLKFPVVSETFVKSEIEKLIELGFDVEVFSHLPGDQNCDFKYLNRIHYVSFENPEIINLIQSKKPTHLHSHFANVAYKLCYPIAKALNIPFSFTAHASYDLFNANTCIKSKELKRMSDDELCTGVVCISEFHLDYLIQKGVNPKRIKIIPNSINLERINKIAGAIKYQDKKYIVGVGRLIEAKGFNHLIKVFEKIQDKDIELRIIGADKGEGERLKELAKSDKRIIFLGEQIYESTIREIRNASILVAPSVVATDGSRDGIPTVLLEAMACKVPVIASNLSGIPYLIKNGKNGLLIPPGEPEKIFKAIAKFLEDEKVRQRCIENAYKTVKDRDISNTIKKLIPVFTENVNGYRQQKESIYADMPIYHEGFAEKEQLTQADHVANMTIAKLSFGKVLEVGCGRGDSSVILGALGHEVYGLDSNADIIQKAVKHIEGSFLDNVKFVVGDGKAIPFPDDSFDSVILPGILEHVPDSKPFIAEAQRVCRAGGRIIISVPNEGRMPDPYHIREFSKKKLTNNLSQFTREKIHFESYMPPDWLLAYFKNTKGNKELSEIDDEKIVNLQIPRLSPLIDSEKVTVMMSTYNRGDTIETALQSIINQTYKKLEIIIINDGSTDNTDKVLSKYKDIVYIKQENAGKPTALNKALDIATGKYIMFFDDDDIAFPKKIEIQVRCFQSNKKIDFIHADAFHFDDKTGRYMYRWIAADISDNEVLKKELNGNRFHSPTVIAKKALYAKAGKYDIKLIRAQDYDMWLRFLFAGAKVGKLNVPTVHYRIHAKKRGSKEDSFSHEELFNKTIDAEKIIFKKIVETVPLEKIFPELKMITNKIQKREATAAALTYRASLLFPRGLFKEAIDDLDQAVGKNKNKEIREEIKLLIEKVARHGLYLGQLTEAERAVKLLQKLDKESDLVEQFIAQINIERDLGNKNPNYNLIFESANNLLNKFSKKLPSSDMLIALAMIASHFNKVTIAKNLLEKAIGIDSNKKAEKLMGNIEQLKCSDPSILNREEVPSLIEKIERVLKYNTLSLIMIVKDEEEYLERCLKSLDGVVDEIVVVDTGSADRTVEVAKAHGAKIIHQKWNNDFSEARNVSIDNATGDWVMFIDADEELSEDNKELLKELKEDVTHEGFQFIINSYVGERVTEDSVINIALRMWRNRPTHRFYGALHEQIMDRIMRSGPVKSTNVQINHYGYLNKSTLIKSKSQRNLDIAIKMIEDEPSNPFNHFSLGMEYARLSNWENAYLSFKKAAQLLGNTTEPYYSHVLALNRVRSLRNLHRYDEALDLIKKLHIKYPKFPDLYLNEALVLYDANNYLGAVQVLRELIKIKPDFSKYATQSGITTFRPYYMLGRIYEQIGDEKQAVYWYSRALKTSNSINEYTGNLMKLLLATENEEEVEKFILKNINADDKYTVFEIGKVFLENKHPQIALNYLEKAASFDSRLPHLDFYLGKAKTLLNQYDQALVHYSNILQTSEDYLPSRVELIILFIIKKKYSEASNILKAMPDIGLYNSYKSVLEQLINILNNGKELKQNFDQNHSDIFWKLLNRFIQHENYEIFEQALKLISKLRVDEGLASLNLGKIYYQNNFNDLATEQFLTAMQKGYFDSESLAILGDMCIDKGLNEDAINFYQNAIMLEPLIMKNFIKLSQLLMKNNRSSEAKEVLQQAIKLFPESEILKQAINVLELISY